MPTASAGFDDLVPSWMFTVRSVAGRLAVAVVVAGLVSIPVLVLREAPRLGLAPVLVIGAVIVAAVAGWWATTIASALLLAAYTWNGVWPSREITLDGTGVASVAVLGVMFAGLVVLTWQVERSVEAVRRLDEERREAIQREAASRRTAEATAAQSQFALRLASELPAARTMVEVANRALDQLDQPARPSASSIAIIRGGRLRILASRGATRRSVELLERTEIDASQWFSQVVSGEPAIVDDREEFAREHPREAILTLYPRGSWAVVPFRAEGTVGLLSVYYFTPQKLTAYRQYFSIVAELVAAALERTRAEEQVLTYVRELEQAFNERDRIARTLSTTLLPPKFATIAGTRASGWVVPGTADRVAGDFYDLFPVDGSDWVAVLGDVCGNGAEAAAVTSLARYAARVTTLHDPDPVGIAEVVNDALDTDSSDLHCTMAVVRYRKAFDAIEVTLAGHPHVRVIHDGEVHRVGKSSPPVGLGLSGFDRVSHPFLPGDCLVLFSDGVIERDDHFGEDELDSLLAGFDCCDAVTLADLFRKSVLELPQDRIDDIAALVVSRDA
jgi:sigma-B regulation protein RsbU (phosphoserine phosphatase)